MSQSILYVDVENLKDVAKEVLVSTINSWPAEFPKFGIVKLYVKADQTEIWRIWATHHLTGVEIVVKGVQHYAVDGSKNSADISLALDVAADVLKVRTEYVAILSDDSDFANVFSFLKQEGHLTENSKVPFKWFMTDRGTEYCSNREHHEYEIYLAIEDIDHSKTKARSPQTNGVCERFHRTIQDEFYATAFRKKIYHSAEEIQEDADKWIEEYNKERTHSGRYCFGKTP